MAYEKAYKLGDVLTLKHDMTIIVYCNGDEYILKARDLVKVVNLLEDEPDEVLCSPVNDARVYVRIGQWDIKEPSMFGV